MLISSKPEVDLLTWIHQITYSGGIFNVKRISCQIIKKWYVGSCNLCRWRAKCSAGCVQRCYRGWKACCGDVFLETTLNNIKANGGKIAISVYDAQNLDGYQIKGSAEYITEGAVVDTFKAMVEEMFHGAANAKGALIITPSKVIVTTPGAENKKELC